MLSGYISFIHIEQSSIDLTPVLRPHISFQDSENHHFNWSMLYTHTHTHRGSQLAVNDLDEIDLAAGQITVCAAHPGLINTKFTQISVFFFF